METIKRSVWPEANGEGRMNRGTQSVLRAVTLPRVMLHWWMHAIKHLSKPTECTTLRLNPKDVPRSVVIFSWKSASLCVFQTELAPSFPPLCEYAPQKTMSFFRLSSYVPHIFKAQDSAYH